MYRITFTQISDLVMANVAANQEKIAKLQGQLSSGKALNRPSDAPIEVVNDLSMRTDLAHRTQAKRNSDNGGTYLSVLDSTLMSFDDLFQRTRELALQGSNDTLLPRDRQYVNNEVKQILLQMVNTGNASYKGDFLFSGTDTDKAPYSVHTGKDNIDAVNNPADPSDPVWALNTPIAIFDRNLTDSTATISTAGNPSAKRIVPGTLTAGTLVEGTDYNVDYVKGTMTFLTPAATAAATAGTLDLSYDWVRRNELPNANGDIKREVDKDSVVNINVKADDLFGAEGTTDTFSSMISLMQGLHTSTQGQIESSITNLDASFQKMLGQQSSVGAWTNRIQMASDRNQENIIQSTDLQSKLEDVDFASAISQYSLADSVYQASLKSASKILTQSLMNYI